MMDAFDRPTGDDHEQLGSTPHRRPKQLRETQIITDKWRDNAIVPLECHDLLARLVMLRLPAQSERLAFAVPRNLLSLRRKHCRLIATAGATGDRDKAAHQVNVEFPSGAGKEVGGFRGVELLP